MTKNKETAKPSSVLVVDDEPGIREMMRLVLVDAGYQVTGAADGREALAVITKSPVDLVVTDMFMPEGDGFELLAEVKKHQPETRVIVVSGGGMSGVDYSLKMARKLGAHAVLKKPFSGEELLAATALVLKKTD